MKFGVLVMAALLGGCATTPLQVVESGERFTMDSARDRSAAAECIARNADGQNIRSRIRPGDAGAVEVVLTMATTGFMFQSLDTAVALAQVHSRGAGSQVTMIVSPEAPRPKQVADLLTGGC
jgi:hypothetical protein